MLQALTRPRRRAARGLDAGRRFGARIRRVKGIEDGHGKLAGPAPVPTCRCAPILAPVVKRRVRPGSGRERPSLGSRCAGQLAAVAQLNLSLQTHSKKLSSEGFFSIETMITF